MRNSLLVIVLCLFSVATLRTNPNYSYEDYCLQFGKQYDTDRIQLFNRNYRQFMDLVDHGVDLSIGPFLDLTFQQLGQYFGFNPTNLGIPLSSPPRLSLEVFSPPSRFDWRQKQRVTSIKHQGICGACWAFSSTAQYQSLISIQSNGKIFDLSEQYVTQCQNKMSQGCNGGYPYKALQMIAQTGIPSQQDYPYQQNSYSYLLQQICSNQTKNFIKLNNPVSEVKHYENLNSDESLQEYLVRYGPLSVAVTANNYQFLYAPFSGLISCPNNANVDHAVLLVGYNQTHWFIKNSWGVNWGHNGFGYISKDTSHNCRIRQWVDVMKVVFDTEVVNVQKQKQQITIKMSDSGNDGWNNNIVGLRQGKQILGTFGGAFTSGSSSQTKILVYPNQEIQVIMIQGGLRRQQMSFQIWSSKGSLVIDHKQGKQFDLQIIFGRFCLSSKCQTSSEVKYYLEMSDQLGDGWNGNQFSFIQDKIKQIFSLSNQTSTDQQKVFQFKKFQRVDICLEKLGQKIFETQFTLRDERGDIITQKKLGTPVYANSILDSFKPEQKNYSPVPILIVEENSQQVIGNSQKVYKILTIIFASLLGLTIIALIIVIIYAVRLRRAQKEGKQSNKTIETGKSLMEKPKQNEKQSGQVIVLQS